MKYLLRILALFLTFTATAQMSSANKKVRAYTADGQNYTAITFDSVRHWYQMNHFVSSKMIKEAADTVYFQVKHFDKSLVADRYQKDGGYCDNQKKKNLKEIEKQFPYSATRTVMVVSFKALSDEVEREIPKTNGQVDFQKMFESRKLDHELTEKMLDILVNYDNKDGAMDVMMCYEPRNGIVFLDKSDQVLGYIEICFDCLQYNIEPKTIRVGSFCTEKMDAIQELSCIYLHGQGCHLVWIFLRGRLRAD